jgi:hypothetical protein
MSRFVVLPLLLLLATTGISCGEEQSEPAPVPALAVALSSTPSPTPTPTPEPAATPRPTPEPTAAATPARFPDAQILETESSRLLRSTIVCDQRTGVPVTIYYVPQANVHAGYFDNPLYLNDDTFFFLSDADNGLNLYVHNPAADRKITDLAGKDVYAHTDSFGLTLTVAGGRLFFSHDSKVYEYTYPSTESRLVVDLGKSRKLWGPIKATRDGAYLSATVSQGDVTFIARIETLSGEVELLESPFLGNNKPIANHANINPTNKDLVMFAHEGHWVRDRIWMWDIASRGTEWEDNEAYQFHRQPAWTEWGHEYWSADGTKVYVVQYGSPDRGVTSGVNIFSTDGRVIEEIRIDAYDLSHASTSPDERYIVSDTYRPDENGIEWIVLYDMDGKQISRITPGYTSRHPAHPHPSWSPSGNKIMFTTRYEGNIAIGEVSLSDILSVLYFDHPSEEC